MGNYSKVQFISWELNTGPFIFDSQKDTSAGFYSGIWAPGNDHTIDIKSQYDDIVARVAFTTDAIAKALIISDKSPTTLKIFMGPEFLYRGAGGAYLHDLLNGWEAGSPEEYQLPPSYNKWAGLFGLLRASVIDNKYADWLFVFGTAISATYPTAKNINNKYIIDPTKPGEIYNTALIQCGGIIAKNNTYASRKHYISGIDFLKWSTNVKQHLSSSVLPLDPKTLIPADVMGISEGSAVFNFNSINDSTGKSIDFGIEICLDHLTSGGNYANDFGRIRTAGQSVKIQLVPSSGATLKDKSIRLEPAGMPTPNSYAFNCDGLGNLARTAGCHTQIWNGSNGVAVAPVNKLFEASSGEPLANTRTVAVSTILGNIDGTLLWNNGMGNRGAGTVRIMNSMPL